MAEIECGDELVIDIAETRNRYHDQLILKCAYCRSPHVHHTGLIYNYRLGENSPNGMSVDITDPCDMWGWAKHHADANLDKDGIKIDTNPKHIGYRGSLLIKLRCEEGCPPFYLQIMQHKGSTYMSAHATTCIEEDKE